MKRIALAFALVLTAISFALGQSVNNKGTKEQDTQSTSVSGTVLRFNDTLGTQTNSFEMVPTGGPATVTVTIDGCMRGGKCNTSIGSTSSTTSTIINLTMTNGPYDFYNVNVAFTGGTNPTFTFNRTGTAARSSGAAAGVSSVAVTAPVTTSGATGAITLGCATCTVTVASGTAALATSSITNATCATVVTAVATGGASTDNVMADFNGDPSGVTGYNPAAGAQALTIYKWVSANQVNFKVCNFTTTPITPGAITLNWRIPR